jgi:hypothetical protein
MITMVKVFTFCLFGPPNPRYYPVPMLQNISLIRTYFPEWKVYLYTAPDVQEEFLSQVAMYSNVVVRPTGKLGNINMMERFLAIDDEDVEIMMVRDADSHVHWKDRWAIFDFLNRPEFLAHTIRDNVEHTAKLMGGLWGIRKIPGFKISELYQHYIQNPIDLKYGLDQSFLTLYVYPYVINVLLVHVSRGPTFKNEHVIRFPFMYNNFRFCGRNDGSDFIDTPQPKKDALSFIFEKTSIK